MNSVIRVDSVSPLTHCPSAFRIRITAPGECSASGCSSGKTLDATQRTTRASSSQAPASVSASSVDRTNLERSGRVLGQVLRVLGALLGFGMVKIISTKTGPETRP